MRIKSASSPSRAAMMSGEEGQYLTDRLTDETIDSIKKVDTYHKQWQNMPHYAAMVESMDENVRRPLQVPEQENLSENTIVVFPCRTAHLDNVE